MKVPFFKQKPEYAAPQVAPIPEDQATKQSGVLINEQGRCFRVEIVDHGTPESLAMALGNLEIAKDVIKQQMSVWHSRDQRRAAILVPRGNGNGHA